MTRRHEGLTLEAHQALGPEMQAMRERIVRLSMDLSAQYGIASRSYILAARALRALDDLRAELDARVIAEHSEMTSGDLLHVYYGAT